IALCLDSFAYQAARNRVTVPRHTDGAPARHSRLQVNVLLKPHNYLYTKYASQNWEQRLQDFAATHENVSFVTNPNTQELYPLADIMITDTDTTAALEYSILGKPLIINYDAQWFAENSSVDIERDLCDLAFRYQTLPQLETLLQKLLQAPDKSELQKQKLRQKQIVEKYLYQPGLATQKAVKAIYQIWEMKYGR
ncbi:MAG: CDP-glycerol glycerophosphotransferase family protein, partial [Candidatus Cloacimonadales bacterium]